MRLTSLAAIAIALTMYAAAPASADPIPGLYNTGVDAEGNPLPANGATDGHYRANGSPPTTFYTVAYVWAEDARWISELPGGQYSAPIGPEGAYIPYTLSFSLDGLNPQTARITGSWAADNVGQLLLNGIPIITTTDGFGALQRFDIKTGFKDGVNTLTFIINDWGQPSAFVVSGLSGTADRYADPIWLPGEWSNWSNTCGEATRNRNLTCVRPENGQELHQDHCSNALRPSTIEQAHQVSGCTYSWQIGEWSSQEPSCGATEQVRSVTCLRSDGQAVTNGFCPDPMPAITLTGTNHQTCTYSWIMTDWTIPSACGPTTRTRSVACLRSDLTQVEAGCEGDAPAGEEAVIDYSGCSYRWELGAYSEWSACENGTQFRSAEAHCLRSDGEAVDNALCMENQPNIYETRACTDAQPQPDPDPAGEVIVFRRTIGS